MHTSMDYRQCAAGPRFPPPGSSALPDGGKVPSSASTPRKVLVVDDEPDLAELAGALFCGHGLDARIAHSAQEALAILGTDPEIDAVFSDVMMPGMNGLQLAETVRHLYPKVHIVLTTGFISPVLAETHSQHYPCVAKPYRIETVLALFRSRFRGQADS
ncbi:response regulator [Massilia brevitalea]|uniref:response regulator n=1 Tax=Massilia brevitalea TaxID=442526 RepID=UPI002738B8AC|nr:response regulator [Massilia brevitalea]